MAYTPVPTGTTSDTISAAYWNTYLRDNFAAGIPGMFANKGDLLIATGNQAASILPKGTDGKALLAASVQATGLIWGNPFTHTLISQTKLGSNTATFSFSSIPATYKYLRIIIAGMEIPVGSETNDQCYMIFNSDAGANYDYELTQFQTTGQSVSDAVAASFITIGYLPSTYGSNLSEGVLDIIIPNYAGTTFQKQALCSTVIRNPYKEFTIGYWRNTAAINRIDFSCYSTANFLAGSVFSLYGL